MTAEHAPPDLWSPLPNRCTQVKGETSDVQRPTNPASPERAQRARQFALDLHPPPSPKINFNSNHWGEEANYPSGEPLKLGLGSSSIIHSSQISYTRTLACPSAFRRVSVQNLFWIAARHDALQGVACVRARKKLFCTRCKRCTN